MVDFGTALSLIQEVIKLEEDLREIVQKFADAPKTAYEMQLFGGDVNRVKLQFLLMALKWQIDRGCFSQGDELKLENAARILNEQLKKVKEYLENHLPEGFGSRLIWALSAESKASTMIGEFEKSLERMAGMAELADLAPPRAALPEDDFSTLSLGRKEIQAIDLKFHAYYATAHHNPNSQSRETNTPPINVFVESYDTSIKKSIDVNERAGEIARRLVWSRGENNNGMGYQTGLLPCLGHHKGRVIFLFPKNALHPPQTLSKLIHDSNEDQHKTIAPLEARFDLALQLSEAVLKVHTLGLAHRDIRSDTILFLKPEAATGQHAEFKTEPGTSSNAENTRDPSGRGRKSDKDIQSRETQPSKKERRRSRSESLRRLGSKVKETVRGAKTSKKNPIGKDQNIEKQGQLLLSPGNDNETVGDVPPGFGGVYLASWYSLKYRGVVPKAEKRSWKRDLYRHPEQQGQDIRKKYNMGHDIYSLGVCLIEIGVWDTLVRTSGEADSLFGRLVEILEIEKSEESLKQFLEEGGGPERLKQALGQIAEEILPSSMGAAYTKLVKACLTCLDDNGEINWGGVKFEKLDRSSDCDAFRKIVLSFLRNVKVAFNL
ncbi:MAG: hypothetical protein MMC33_003444 [Icmadophila ericetorum]|nr:hypothetical protein [Icmadophila ericetorum]